MAHYVGFVPIPHGSYQEWRNATLGNGYDFDGWWGEQCWDFCQMLYAQYNLTLQTGDGTAAGCWLLRRAANSVNPFESIAGYQNIKRGDIVVFNRTPSGYAGHIAFADQDYTGGTYMNFLGQNQLGYGSGSPATVNRLNATEALGVFRNKYWAGIEPEPETSDNIHRYNFVLFNRRKRQEEWTKKPLKRR